MRCENQIRGGSLRKTIGWDFWSLLQKAEKYEDLIKERCSLQSDLQSEQDKVEDASAKANELVERLEHAENKLKTTTESLMASEATKAKAQAEVQSLQVQITDFKVCTSDSLALVTTLQDEQKKLSSDKTELLLQVILLTSIYPSH